jgi:hypothetical protein
MKEIDERNIDPLEEITRIGQSFLQLHLRGFKESYRSVKPENIIYDSEWCRLNILWGGWDYINGNSIHIRYGRLHAVNDKTTMLWNGEECYCWHRIEHALHFLDGRTPTETAKLNYSHPIIKSFYQEEILRKFNHKQPEWIAQIHVAIWQHYGQKLFDLFDLTRPDLWQQYRQFLKEVYDLDGRYPDVKPPEDNVC